MPSGIKRHKDIMHKIQVDTFNSSHEDIKSLKPLAYESDPPSLTGLQLVYKNYLDASIIVALNNFPRSINFPTTGDFSVNWQTDIPDGYAQTYAELLGNKGFKADGVLEDSGVFSDYKIPFTYTKSGELIDVVNFSPVFSGIAILTS